MNRLIKIITGSALSCLLLACGDESSSNENNSSAINADNAENLVFATNEATLRINEVAVDLIDAISVAHGNKWAPGDYYIQSQQNLLKTMAFSFIDLDSNGKISSGDQCFFSYLPPTDTIELYSQNPTSNQSSQLELTIIELSENETELTIRLEANAENISYQQTLLPGLFSPISIDRSSTDAFSPTTESPELPSAIDFVNSSPAFHQEFTLAGKFLIDLTQIKSESQTTQDITILAEDFSLDYFYSENDIVLFSDFITGDLNFENSIAINEATPTNSLFRTNNDLFFPTSTSLNASNLDYFTRSIINASLFSAIESTSFEVLTLSELLGEKTLENTNNSLTYYDGKILLSSQNSFGTQINFNGNWQINIGNESFLSPVQPGLTSPFSQSAVLESKTCKQNQNNAGCTTSLYSPAGNTQNPTYPGGFSL